jgi:HSP20 family molecular chaperone IbpA
VRIALPAFGSVVYDKETIAGGSMSVIVATGDPFGGMARQMGKMIDQLHKGYYNFAPGETWTPSVNLYELDATYLVCVDLAGIDKEKLDITVEDHLLKLHGHREVPMPTDAEAQHQRLRVHLMEIDHGSFSREVELPHNVAHEKIQAQYRNGMLWIELPKK